MSLHALLATATRPAHDALERSLDLERDLSPANYGLHLRCMHAFLRETEELLAGDERLAAAGLALDSRRKLPWLERDLDALGLEALEPPETPALPADLHRRIGWAYVLEGSTLGGRVLYRRIAPHLHLSAKRGAAFLNGHGEHTGEMWKRFVAALDALPLTSAQSLECVAGAREAFAAVGDFFVACGWPNRAAP